MCVLSGVPQGSVLDPLLFLIYIVSITKVPLSQHTKITLYADDMLLYKPICTQPCYVELQQDINSIYQWSQENLMSFNLTKCKSMLLINKRKILYPTMTLNHQPLENVQQYNYLGVILSYNLCWSHHVQAICKRARKVLGIIVNLH